MKVPPPPPWFFLPLDDSPRGPLLPLPPLGEVLFTGTTATTSTADITVESLLEVKRQFDALPRPEYDCIVCRRVEWEKLVKAVVPEWERKPWPLDRLYGIEFHLADSDVEAGVIAADLHSRGRRVGLLMPDGSIVKP